MTLHSPEQRYFRLNFGHAFFASMRANTYAPPNSLASIIANLINDAENKHAALNEATLEADLEAILNDSGFKFSRNSWYQWFHSNLGNLKLTLGQLTRPKQFPLTEALRDRLAQDGVVERKLQNNILCAIANWDNHIAPLRARFAEIEIKNEGMRKKIKQAFPEPELEHIHDVLNDVFTRGLRNHDDIKDIVKSRVIEAKQYSRRINHCIQNCAHEIDTIADQRERLRDKSFQNKVIAAFTCETLGDLSSVLIEEQIDESLHDTLSDILTSPDRHFEQMEKESENTLLRHAILPAFSDHLTQNERKNEALVNRALEFIKTVHAPLIKFSKDLAKVNLNIQAQIISFFATHPIPYKEAETEIQQFVQKTLKLNRGSRYRAINAMRKILLRGVIGDEEFKQILDDENVKTQHKQIIDFFHHKLNKKWRQLSTFRQQLREQISAQGLANEDDAVNQIVSCIHENYKNIDILTDAIKQGKFTDISLINKLVLYIKDKFGEDHAHIQDQTKRLLSYAVHSLLQKAGIELDVLPFIAEYILSYKDYFSNLRQQLQLDGLSGAPLKQKVDTTIARAERFPEFANLLPKMICAFVSQYANAVINADMKDFKIDLEHTRFNVVRVKFNYDLTSESPHSSQFKVCGQLKGTLEISADRIAVKSMQAIFDKEALTTFELEQLKTLPKVLEKTHNNQIPLAKYTDKQSVTHNKKVSFLFLINFFDACYRHIAKLTWIISAATALVLGGLYFFFAATLNPSIFIIHPSILVDLFGLSLVIANVIGSVAVGVFSLLFTKGVTHGLFASLYFMTRKVPFAEPTSHRDVFEFDCQSANVTNDQPLPKPLLGNRDHYAKIMAFLTNEKARHKPVNSVVELIDHIENENYAYNPDADLTIQPLTQQEYFLLFQYFLFRQTEYDNFQDLQMRFVNLNSTHMERMRSSRLLANRVDNSSPYHVAHANQGFLRSNSERAWLTLDRQVQQSGVTDFFSFFERVIEKNPAEVPGQYHDVESVRQDFMAREIGNLKPSMTIREFL